MLVPCTTHCHDLVKYAKCYQIKVINYKDKVYTNLKKKSKREMIKISRKPRSTFITLSSPNGHVC